MIRPILVLAAVAALAACEPATTAEAPAPDAAATPTSAEIDLSDDGPEAFVQNVYSALATDAPTFDEGLWSSAAWAAIEAHQAADETGFDVDPLCDCQDPAGIVVQSVDIAMTGADSADAAVTTTQGEAQVSQVLKLVRENGRWRIDDIAREGDPSFRQGLAG